MKKKLILTTLVLVVFVTGLAFATTATDSLGIFKEITGKDPVAGTPMMQQAIDLGKGEAFFTAMHQSRIDSIQSLVTDGTLTQSEADFMISRMNSMTYADMLKMQEIREKLRDKNVQLPGFMGKGNGQGRGFGRNGMGNQKNCPYYPQNGTNN